MHSQTKIAVAGATGRVGHHVVDLLDARRTWRSRPPAPPPASHQE
jgi:uncharacterized protein YbjT (DUF2867 family)